ncbi:MAG: hypothetical protein Q9176_002767 [Flavoplaca citrina]
MKTCKSSPPPSNTGDMAIHSAHKLLLILLIQLLSTHRVSSAAIRPVQSIALIANLTKAGLLPSELRYFPPGRPEEHYPYLIPNTDLGIEFHPLGLVPHRNEAVVRKVLQDSIYASLEYRVSAKMPGWGYSKQEGGFLLSVGHSTGASEFTWGMWTIVLTGLNEYVSAYPGYDFQFQIRRWAEEELMGKVIGAGFAKMR